MAINMTINMARFKQLLYVLVLLLVGVSSVNAANAANAQAPAKKTIPPHVPITSLTKNCKPLINKNLKIPKVAIRGMSERANKRINRALEKLADEKYAEAIEQLNSLLTSSKDQNVQAVVAKFMGIAYAQQSKSIKATQYFSKALDLGKGYLQHQEIQDLTQNVASMLYGADKKKKAIEYLKRWMKNSNVDNNTVYLLYSAILFDQGKIKQAVCPAYWSAKTSKKPNKSALGILLNAHFEFKDYVGVTDILKQLVLDFPTEKRFWRNLSTVYLQRDMINDALAVMEMFYTLGYMETENDYKQLSSVFAYGDIPYRTATILKEGIDKGVVDDNEKNWKNIASNFHVASELEKAIDAYGRSAEKSSSGENDLKRAELLADTDRYKEAITGFDKAIKKGSLKDVGKAYFRKGLAHMGLKQYNSAINALNKAGKYKKWRKQAGQWVGFVRNQQKNAAKL